MRRYQLSPYIRTVTDPESKTAMVYHALYGNPRIVNDEGLRFLNLFKQPKSEEEIAAVCDEDPRSILGQFAEILFLVEPGFDEKRMLREKRDKQLVQVHRQLTVDRVGLSISDLCNLGCGHCIHFQREISSGQALSTYRKTAHELNMTWATAKQCVDQYVKLMRQQGRTHGNLHFGNAEPLINWPVIEQVLEYCGKMEGFSFEFAINTNLTLMTKHIAEVLKKFQVRIATSLDGTQAANDAVRTTRDGKGTFALILEKFDLLARLDYPLDGFSITVTNGNFDLIDTDVLDLAIERKMTSIAFDYDLVGLVDVPVETRISKLMRLKRYANAHGIEFFGTWDSPFRNLTTESILYGDRTFCAAVQGKALEFNVDGSIKICSHTTTLIGHVSDFKEVFKENGALTQTVSNRFPGTDEFCFGCDIEGPCGGQCQVTREVTARSVGGQRQKLFADMCDFYRKVTEALALDYLRSNGNLQAGKRPNCTL